MEFVTDFFTIVGVLTTFVALVAFATVMIAHWTAPR